MNAKPILFNGNMVRAILDGRKTQTRRIINPQPAALCPEPYWNARKAHPEMLTPRIRFLDSDGDPYSIPFPYGNPSGKPGSYLWVRESLTLWPGTADYTADGAPVCHQNVSDLAGPDGYPRAKVPSIHMPRWASRITLRIIDIRVERLQDISEEDAMAEGIYNGEYDPKINDGGKPGFTVDGINFYGTAAHCFEELWESTYGLGSWAKNDWVWAITFEPIFLNIDQVGAA